jgi:hypothetical protein
MHAPARCAGMSESELRARVVKLAHFHGWRVFSLPIARTRRPVKDAVGYPDLTLAKQGRVLWIELKTEAGVLSVEQMSWFKELAGRMIVVRPSDLDNMELVLR